MAIEQIETLYGLHLNSYNEIWAGTAYNKVLLEDYPSSSCTSTTTSASGSYHTFIYPKTYKHKFYLDGDVEGQYTIYNGGGVSRTHVKGELELLKIDITGTETSLASFDNTVNHSVAASTFVKFLFNFKINHQVIKPFEKIAFKIKVSETPVTGDIVLSHYNDNTEEDLKIKIPFAPQGGV